MRNTSDERAPHAVIAGTDRDAVRLAGSFAATGRRVAVIGEPADEQALAAVRGAGAVPVPGVPTSDEVLKTAGVAGAQYFVALCPGDAASLAAGEAAASAGGPDLQVFVRVTAADLFTRLSTRWFEPTSGDGPRIDVFDPSDVAARLMLERHPPAQADEVAIVGGDSVARRLLLNAAREWYRAHGGAGVRLRTTVVAPDARETLDRLRAEHPTFDELCEAHAVTAGPGALERPISRRRLVVVSAPGERDAVAIAQQLGQISGAAIDAICVPNGEAEVRCALADLGAGDAEIDVFGVEERIYTQELVLRGIRERLAEAIHEDYARHERERHPGESAPLPWRDLPESSKQSNREQADDVRRKLAELGCLVEPLPLPDPGSTPIVLTDAEIEPLAVSEHDRWMARRRSEGRVYGAVKDDTADPPTHPLLVPWSELPEEEREKDRDTVRDLVPRLERLGFRVVRRGDRAG